MPEQKPGRSKQDYGTPRPLIHAIENRWGKINWDLAASAENAKAPNYITAEQDSLSIDWVELSGLKFLNPPFARIEPWAKKCKESYWRGSSPIILLVPASIGSEWYREHCYHFGRTIGLSPRLTFEGESNPYPKDCMCVTFGLNWGYKYDDLLPILSVWRWDEEFVDA